MEKQQRIFEGFASGYTCAVKTDYDNRVIGLLMSAWDDENPAPATPQPLEVEEKVKGGTRKRKLLQDPDYLAALQRHKGDLIDRENRRSAAQTRLILLEGIDPTSIDMDLVARGREVLEKRYGTRGENNDVLFYLNLIGDPGQGKPGDKDYRPNELFELIRFIGAERGAPGALVQHLLLSTFQDDDLQSQNGTVSGYLGGQPAARDSAETDSTATLN